MFGLKHVWKARNGMMRGVLFMIDDGDRGTFGDKPEIESLERETDKEIENMAHGGVVGLGDFGGGKEAVHENNG